MTTPIDSFSTARLLAKRLAPPDFPDYCGLGRDPAVRAWLGGKLLSEAEAQATLDVNLAHWQQHGFGIWTLREIC